MPSAYTQNFYHAVFGIVDPARGNTMTLLSLPNFASAASSADCGSLKGVKPICRISSCGQLDTTYTLTRACTAATAAAL